LQQLEKNRKHHDPHRLQQFRSHVAFLLSTFTQKVLAGLMEIDQSNFSKQIKGVPSKKFLEKFYKTFTHILRQADQSGFEESPREIKDEDPLMTYLDHQFAEIRQELKLIRFHLQVLASEDHTPTSPK
jgi:hypothetical protein